MKRHRTHIDFGALEVQSPHLAQPELGKTTAVAKLRKKGAPTESEDVKKLKEKPTSPWEVFEKVVNLQLDDAYTMASRQAPSRQFVLMKSFSGPNATEKVRISRAIRHENFFGVLEYIKESRYIVFEDASICLEHIVKCTAYPTERQLAAIFGQVLNGLDYLNSLGMEHGSLNCSTILINDKGVIKICPQYCHENLRTNSSVDIKALGFIAVKLMQKFIKENGALGLEDLVRWPSDSAAVEFVSMTTSATSVIELRKHTLFKSWEAEELQGIVRLAIFTVSHDWWL